MDKVIIKTEVEDYDDSNENNMMDFTDVKCKTEEVYDTSCLHTELDLDNSKDNVTNENQNVVKIKNEISTDNHDNENTIVKKDNSENTIVKKDNNENTVVKKDNNDTEPKPTTASQVTVCKENTSR